MTPLDKHWGGTYILDADHNVIMERNTDVWAQWYNKPINRVVAQEIIGPYRVSTVFLGVDHQFSEDGPPLLFETMIFGGRFDDDEYQTRCSTWDGALKMHARAREIAWKKDAPGD